MSELTVSGVSLRGVSAAVPQLREDNAELDALTDSAKQEIIDRVGIRYRHISNSETTAADLCQKAAEQLLNELAWNRNEIGLLVFVTQTPDHTVPGTATQLQEKLGLPENAISLDINQGCAGYVYGMSVLAGMMNSFGIQKGLLLVGDTITKIISKKDNSLRPIFSDAGSASAFELSQVASKMTFSFGSRGKDFEAIHMPHGGFRFPTTESSLKEHELERGVIRNLNQLSMNGQAVFTFGLSTVAKSIKSLLDETTVSPTDIDFVVLHQANQLLNDSIVRKTGFTVDQAPSSLYEHGNTSCATIPVTLVANLIEQLRTRKLKLVLTGFGVGLSWGNVILETDQVVCPELILV